MTPKPPLDHAHGAHADDAIGDMHVHPAFGPRHQDTRACWCSPTIDKARRKGAARVVIHRSHN